MLALLGLSLLLGATAYESVVMAPNYERDVPASIDVARQFLKRTTPAAFFRVLAPLTQVLLLACVIVCWRVPGARWPAVAALGALVIADIITFTFHYPRLAIMFGPSASSDPGQLRIAAHQWAQGNIVRLVLIVAAWVCVLWSLIANATNGKTVGA